MTEDEYETKLGDLELKIEDMERDKSFLWGAIAGLCSYLAWYDPWVSIGIGGGSTFLYWKLLAEKPFTGSVSQTTPEN